jgi:hypothetical protein
VWLWVTINASKGLDKRGCRRRRGVDAGVGAGIGVGLIVAIGVGVAISVGVYEYACGWL